MKMEMEMIDQPKNKQKKMEMVITDQWVTELFTVN